MSRSAASFGHSCGSTHPVVSTDGKTRVDRGLGRWLASLDIPVLLIAGERDRVVDFGHLDELERQHDHVSVEVWRGGAHRIPLTHPRASATAVARWTSQGSRARGCW